MPKYRTRSDGYRTRNAHGTTIYEHREKVNAPKGLEVDHIDGNKENNDPSNLRLCTRTENCRYRRKNSRNKTSSYKGVERTKNTWYARITIDGKRVYLGTFPSETEAAKAYDAAAVKFFGNFAWLNFRKDVR